MLTDYRTALGAVFECRTALAQLSFSAAITHENLGANSHASEVFCLEYLLRRCLVSRIRP
jgi:hypothetical protein